MFYGLLEVLGPSPTSSPTYKMCSKSANPRLSPKFSKLVSWALCIKQAQTNLINSHGLFASPTSLSRFN